MENTAKHKLTSEVLSKYQSRQARTIIQVLERSAFCLGHEEERQHEADTVPAGIPSECASRRKCTDERGERDRYNKVAVDYRLSIKT